MNHAFFIISCYAITLIVLGALSLNAYLRLKRDKNILQQSSLSRNKDT